MLNDADASGFKKVYLAMGFTDLRISGVGLMVLQTSSGFSFNWILMIKIRCFSFVGENATGSRHYFGRRRVSPYVQKTRQWCIPMATLCGRGNGHHRRTVPHADAGSGDCCAPSDF